MSSHEVSTLRGGYPSDRVSEKRGTTYEHGNEAMPSEMNFTGLKQAVLGDARRQKSRNCVGFFQRIAVGMDVRGA